jgi:hypothetical protein
VAAVGYSRAAVAALEQYGRWRVLAQANAAADCDVSLRQERRAAPLVAPAGWEVVARVRRPTDRDETTLVLRRRP